MRTSIIYGNNNGLMSLLFQQPHIRLLKNHRSYRNPTLLFEIDISNQLKALLSEISEMKI